MSRPSRITPGELLTYLRMLADGCATEPVLRHALRPPAGVMRRRYVSVLRLDQIAERITALAPAADVFVGVRCATAPAAARRDQRLSTALHRVRRSQSPRAARGLRLLAVDDDRLWLARAPAHLLAAARARERSRGREREPQARARPARRARLRRHRADAPPARKPQPQAHAAGAVRLLQHDHGARYALADVLAQLPHDPQPRRGAPPRSRRVIVSGAPPWTVSCSRSRQPTTCAS